MKTLEELIEEGRRLYYADGLSIKDAAAKLAAETYEVEAEDRIRHQGIRDLLKRAVSSDRSIGNAHSSFTPNSRPVLAYRPKRGEGQAIRYHRLASVYYEGTDGTQKALLDFTKDDWGHRLEAERRVVEGAKARHSLAMVAIEALTAERKAVTSKLSRRTLENLEELAAKVYRSAAFADVNESQSDASVESSEGAA